MEEKTDLSVQSSFKIWTNSIPFQSQGKILCGFQLHLSGLLVPPSESPLFKWKAAHSHQSSFTRLPLLRTWGFWQTLTSYFVSFSPSWHYFCCFKVLKDLVRLTWTNQTALLTLNLEISSAKYSSSSLLSSLFHITTAYNSELTCHYVTKIFTSVFNVYLSSTWALTSPVINIHILLAKSLTYIFC